MLAGEQKEGKFSRGEEMTDQRLGVQSLKIDNPPSTGFAPIEGVAEGDGFSPRREMWV